MANTGSSAESAIHQTRDARLKSKFRPRNFLESNLQLEPMGRAFSAKRIVVPHLGRVPQAFMECAVGAPEATNVFERPTHTRIGVRIARTSNKRMRLPIRCSLPKALPWVQPGLNLIRIFTPSRYAETSGVRSVLAYFSRLQGQSRRSIEAVPLNRPRSRKCKKCGWFRSLSLRRQPVDPPVQVPSVQVLPTDNGCQRKRHQTD